MPQIAVAPAAFLAAAGKVVAVASVVYSVSSAAQQRRKAREAAEQAQGVSTMLKDAAAPWVYHYGERRVSGPIVFAQESGQDRKYLNLVIVLAPHEIFEFKWLWFDDEKVDFDPSTGKVTSSNYKDKAWVHFRTGAAGQTAFSELITECPTKWTSAHRLDGCACVYVKMEWDQAVYHGGIPNISATIRGKKLYDPRTSTTYWCANPALIAYDLLTDTRIGAGIPSGSIDTASVIEAANRCDEQLAYVAPAPTDNTPFRYSCHYCADSSVALSDHLDTVVNTMAGAVVRSSGKWFIRAGQYRTPTVTITEDDILGTVTVSPRRTKTDLCNRVRGKYLNIPNGYVATDFPSYTNATYLAQDNGEALWADIDLPATVDPVQAQRLAKIHLERIRQQISVTAPLGLKGLQLMPTDTVRLTLPRYGWVGKVFEVVGWKLMFDTGDDANPMVCQVQLQETASTVYDWSTEETVADAAPDTDLPNPFDVPSPSNVAATAGGHLNADGTWVPTVTVSWDSPANGYVLSGGEILVRYKKSSDSDWTMNPFPAAALSAVISSLAVGAEYDFSVSFINSFGAGSPWVGVGPITILGDTEAPGYAFVTDFAVAPSTHPMPPRASPSGVFYPYGVSFQLYGTDPDLEYFEYTVKTGIDRTTPPTSGEFRYYGRDYLPVYLTGNQRTQLYESYESAYVWIRARDFSGNLSPWSYKELRNLNRGKVERIQGTVAVQDTTDLRTTGVSTGDGSSVRKILARYPFSTSVAFTASGSGNTALQDLDITNRGFTAAPSGASALHKVSTEAAYATWSVIYSPALSTSTSAKLILVAPATIPAGTYTFDVQGELLQW